MHTKEKEITVSMHGYEVVMSRLEATKIEGQGSEESFSESSPLARERGREPAGEDVPEPVAVRRKDWRWRWRDSSLVVLYTQDGEDVMDESSMGGDEREKEGGGEDGSAMPFWRLREGDSGE